MLVVGRAGRRLGHGNGQRRRRRIVRSIAWRIQKEKETLGKHNQNESRQMTGFHIGRYVTTRNCNLTRPNVKIIEFGSPLSVDCGHIALMKRGEGIFYNNNRKKGTTDKQITESELLYKYPYVEGVG